ncbi:MAG: carboxypeptidase-like regulatory domain-containing protein [Candidatus Limnocylindrales bacterium]
MDKQRLPHVQLALILGPVLIAASACVAGGPLVSPPPPSSSDVASAQPTVAAGSISPVVSPSISPSARATLSPAPSRAAPVPSDVSGHVLAGPTCPVETVPPNPACAPRPVSGATILATNQAGTTIARAISRADGSYWLELGPGTYELVPQPVAGQSMRAPASTSVTIGPGTGSVVVDFNYDTGIR